MKAIRWSDNDRYWGPFTVSTAKKERRLALVLGSGDSEYRGCRIRFCIFGLTLICALPPVIRPWGEKWSDHERAYGFSVWEGFLQVFLGRQTGDSSTEQIWCRFLPWTQWRHVRTSYYGSEGAHFWTERRVRWRGLGADESMKRHREIWDTQAACPTVHFRFTDFDGELLLATTRIEEMEWLFGTGWFKWLSLFRRPKVRRSLKLDFSGETGRGKGSWKGGTVGHAIDMLPGELHEQAFRRYCAAHEMTLVGDAGSVRLPVTLG